MAAEEIPEDLTVRGAINAAIEEVNAKQPPDPGASSEMQPEQPQDGRQRDDQGRFAKVEGKPQRETLTLPKKEGQSQPIQPARSVQPSVPQFKAPEAWPADAKAKFSTLDPSLQQLIMRREEDVHRQFTRQDEERTFGKQMQQTVAPYMATIRAEGSNPVEAVATLLNMAHIMRTGTPQQKQALLIQTAQQYNVPLNLPPQQGQQFHPDIAALQQRINQMEQARQADIQQRQSQEDLAINMEVEEFTGGHEHASNPQVRAIMASLLENGAAQDLQDAYDQAIWARPDIRSTLQPAQPAFEEQRLTQARAKTDAARRASVSVTGAPGTAIPVNGAGENRSLRDELRANLRAATGRA